MASVHSNILITLSLIGAIIFTTSFEINSDIRLANPISSQLIQQQSIIQRADQCKTAQLYEYINKFKLPLKDVSNLLTTQFSRFGIQDIQAPNKVKLFNIIAVSKLLSNDQSQSYPSPFRALVSNSQIQFTITYTINITQGTLRKNHTFAVVTKVSNVSINYDKQYKLDTGAFIFNTVTVKVDSNMMTSTFNPNPNKTQEDSFNTAIKGTTQSLYAGLTKLFSNGTVKTSMETNSKGEHLSQIYTQNPYNYKFLSTTIPIDVNTITYEAKDGSLKNGLAGKLPQGNDYCSTFIPDFTNTGSSLFITKQYIQNFVNYNVGSYNGWKSIKINKQTVRSRLLQWQLLDLEYVVDGLWNDMGLYIQNEISFSCDIKQMISTQLDAKNNKLHQTMSWSCQGYVKLNNTAFYKVLDFVPKINHITNMKAGNGQLGLYVNVLQLIDCQYNEVLSLNGEGKYTVNQNGAKVGKQYIESVFTDFRSYPIGDRFKISGNAKDITIEQNGNGIWII